MLSNRELLERPNYLLSTYQLEIYRQLSLYMAANNLKKKDVAEKLNVSNSYVSQIMNGDFNFTLKKLIELGLMMNKVPYLEFIEPNEYWRREKEGTVRKEIDYKVVQGGENLTLKKVANLSEVLNYERMTLPDYAFTTDKEYSSHRVPAEHITMGHEAAKLVNMTPKHYWEAYQSAIKAS